MVGRCSKWFAVAESEEVEVKANNREDEHLSQMRLRFLGYRRAKTNT
jgi:hypothetical protein